MSNFMSEIFIKIHRETPDSAKCDRIGDILPEDLNASYIVGSDTKFNNTHGRHCYISTATIVTLRATMFCIPTLPI